MCWDFFHFNARKNIFFHILQKKKQHSNIDFRNYDLTKTIAFFLFS